MIKVKQNIMSGITPRATTAFKVTKIDCYKPHTVKDEVEICFTCDLPKCIGDDRLCKRYQAMIKEIKERKKRLRRKTDE
jgi:hypothetical protein